MLLEFTETAAQTDRAQQAPVVERSFREILSGTRLMAMGTVGDDGTPWLHNAYFAFDEDLFLYFLTSPASQHARNLPNSGGRTSVVISDTQQEGTPGTRRGVQFQGLCRVARDARVHRAITAFSARFPGFAKAAEASAIDDPTGTLPRLYAVAVTSFKLFDEPALGRDVWLPGRIDRNDPAA